GAWRYLLDVINPDYALLQEAQRRDDLPGHCSWKPIAENSLKYGKQGRYRWGSAVWAREHELSELALATQQGWVQIARTVGEEPLTLISIHVELDREGHSIPTLHRIVSDLTPVLEQATSGLILG